jgi:capsular exopolysaccharide synthesis family protein
MTDAEPRDAHLLDYLRVLVKRRWVVYTCLALVVTTVMLRSLLMEPVYTATATLQIERLTPNVLPFQQVTPQQGGYYSGYGFYETQHGLITSRRVAREVIRTLELANHPEFRFQQPDRVNPGLSAAKVIEGARIGRFLAGLQVSPVSKSRLVNVSFSSHDRALAFFNDTATTEIYTAFNTEAHYNTTERASTSIAGQVATLQDEIREKEEILQAYAREHGIIPINETQNITLKNLTDLNNSFTASKAVRIEKEARFAALREAEPGGLHELVESRLIQELSAKKAELSRRYAQLSEKYGSGWPEMARVRSEIDETERRLAEERLAIYQQVLGTAEADYHAAVKEEAYLAEALDGLKGQAQDLSLKEIEYRTLKTEIENRRETVDALQRRQGETHTSADLNELISSNVRIVDRAEVPLGASKPRLGMDFLLSLVGGLGLGIGLAFFFEYLDKSVKTSHDIQEATSLPALGVIPVWKPAGSKIRLVKSGGGKDPSVAKRVGLIAHEDPGSKISEGIRELRTTLLVSRPGGPPGTILVTSSQPEEGKTAIGVNLAVTLAQMGRRVLMVDADMRKPRLHWILGVSNAVGLSNALSGSGRDGLKVQKTPIQRLDLLASGPTPPNPADLLNSERFAEVQKLLEGAGYDHIIFDSPPVLAVADPCIMAGRMDAVVLVVWAGVTGRDALAHTVGRLRQVKAVITGAVLNKAEPERRYYSRYGYVRRHEPGLAKEETEASRPTGTGA